MPQQTVIHGSHIGAVWVSEESAYGTPGTERRIHPLVDSAELVPAQEDIDKQRLHINVHDYENPVRGYKSATCKFTHYLQPATTYLELGKTPDADAAAPLRIPMRVVLGGESVEAGSTVASATSTNDFDVQAAHGIRFLDGQIIAVDQSGGGGSEDLVPCRVIQRSTDTISVWPDLANQPVSTLRVINSYTWYPTQANTKSMSMAVAPAQGTALQYRAIGGNGNVELAFNRGELLTVVFDLMFASFTGPAALSLGTAVAADPMAPPFSTRNAVIYLQPFATTSRTCFIVDSMNITINNGMEHRETLTCGFEGKAGVMRSANLQDAYAEIDLEFNVDTDFDTQYWANFTDLSMMFHVYVDDVNGDRRMVVVDAPNCIIFGKPTVERGANNLSKMKIKLKTKRDNTCSTTTDLATAPLRIAVI